MARTSTVAQTVDSDGKIVELPLEGYDIYKQDQPTNATDTAYYGYVNTASAWIIQRVTSTQIDYASGPTDFDTNWDNRTSLTYLPFDVEF